MRTIGAFEAKTHFSELLRNVEKGEAYEIQRRGKVVAKLTGAIAGHDERDVEEVLAWFQDVRAHAHASGDEVSSWIGEGRR
jgi:prevent-host-death family protein